MLTERFDERYTVVAKKDPLVRQGWLMLWEAIDSSEQARLVAILEFCQGRIVLDCCWIWLRSPTRCQVCIPCLSRCDQGLGL